MHASQATTNGAAHPVRVHVVDSPAGLAALAAAWETLSEQAAVTSVFASYDWQAAWWAAYGKGQPLRVLVASAGDAVVGILPLYVHTAAMLRLPVRQLRLVGTGGDTYPDDLGPLLAPGREAEVARALAAAVLHLPGWDVLLLHDMDPACAFTAEMTSAARAARLELETGRSERIAFTELPASYDKWLAAMHGDRRYRIKKARKKLLAAHPEARFFVWDDPATIDAGIDRLVHLHHKRWERAGQAHAFSSPEYVSFHRAAMKACLARDRLRLYCLEIGGQVVAMYYFYRFRGRVYLMQSGFDPDFGDVKPGQVLLGYIVEHAIGEGNQVLDFLRGDHRYKDELATGERETVYLTALGLRPGAVLYRVRRRYLPALKARLRQALGKVRPAAPPVKPA